MSPEECVLNCIKEVQKQIIELDKKWQQKPTKLITDDQKRCCGNCAHWQREPGKYGLPRTYCALNSKTRFSNDMEGCLGWKKRN